MDDTNIAATVQMTHDGFDDLKSQILEKNQAVNSTKPEPKEKPAAPSSKKYTFKRGDQAVELDDDYVIEMMADKKPIKLTLRELKDRAAGDIAVKNRMHSLAEEKKRVASTFSQFAEMAKKDPLEALRFISDKAKETDSDFEFDNYILKLAEQAEKLNQMDEKDRKALELEKKLEKANTDLSRKEREAQVVLRKSEILSTYPEIGDSKFAEIVDTVLGSEELSEGLETEEDVMDMVEELIVESLNRRDILKVIDDINPSHINDDALLNAVAEVLSMNPDFDEEDVRDIVREMIGPAPKPVAPVDDERKRASRILSEKAREANSVSTIKAQKMTPYQILEQQLREKTEKQKRTPLYSR